MLDETNNIETHSFNWKNKIPNLRQADHKKVIFELTKLSEESVEYDFVQIF